jgi:cysteine-rich repeat protein
VDAGVPWGALWAWAVAHRKLRRRLGGCPRGAETLGCIPSWPVGSRKVRAREEHDSSVASCYEFFLTRSDGPYGGPLSLSLFLTLGVSGCLEDRTIVDNFPVVCETDADCEAQRSCRAPKIAVCHRIYCECEEPPREPMCGNGELEDGEACDDGNDTSGDGCEPDCTLLFLEMEPKCLASMPVLDDVGRFVPDERGEPTIASTTITNLDSDDSCTFYVMCPIGTRAALPLTVRPMAPFVSREGRIGGCLEQGWSLTGAIRADRPELESFDFTSGRVRFAPSTRPREYSPFYAEIYFPPFSEGPVPLPVPGEPAQWLDIRGSAWELEDDGASGFVIDWLRVDLYTSKTPGVVTECPVIGDASVVYLPGGSE